MAEGNEAECSVCTEPTKLFRVLKCSHFLCEKCCESLKVKNSVSVLCPFDRQTTAVPNGIKSLPIKIATNVTCTSCSNFVTLADHYWCVECSEAVCSSCFMKRHKQHNYVCVDDGKILEECAGYVAKIREEKQAIHTFCTMLEKELIKDLARDDNVQRFIKNVENVIGKSVKYQSQPLKQNVSADERKRKLNFASKVLTSFAGKTQVDIDEIKSMLDKKDVLQMPQVKEIVDFMHRKPVQQLPSEVEMFLSHSDSCDYSDDVRKASLTPALCAALNEGVFVINEDRISKYDTNLNHLIVKGFSDRERLDGNLFHICAVYNEFNDSLFIVKQSDESFAMYEYVTNSVHTNLSRTHDLPMSIDDLTYRAARFYIAVLPDGRMVCTCSDSGTGFLWIFENECWLRKWKRKVPKVIYGIDAQPRSFNDMQLVFVSVGKLFIYVFNVQNRCVHMSTINCMNEQVSSPFIFINEKVFGWDCKNVRFRMFHDICPVYKYSESTNQDDVQLVNEIFFEDGLNTICPKKFTLSTSSSRVYWFGKGHSDIFVGDVKMRLKDMPKFTMTLDTF